MYALFYISTTLSYFSIGDRVGHILLVYIIVYCFKWMEYIIPTE